MVDALRSCHFRLRLFERESIVAIASRTLLAYRLSLTAQQASGLNVNCWCRQEGVSAWIFYAWRKRLASAGPAAPLIAVPLAGMSQQVLFLELQTPGGYVLRL